MTQQRDAWDEVLGGQQQQGSSPAPKASSSSDPWDAAISSAPKQAPAPAPKPQPAAVKSQSPSLLDTLTGFAEQHAPQIASAISAILPAVLPISPSSQRQGVNVKAGPPQPVDPDVLAREQAEMGTLIPPAPVAAQPPAPQPTNAIVAAAPGKGSPSAEAMSNAMDVVLPWLNRHIAQPVQQVAQATNESLADLPKVFSTPVEVPQGADAYNEALIRANEGVKRVGRLTKDVLAPAFAPFSVATSPANPAFEPYSAAGANILNAVTAAVDAGQAKITIEPNQGESRSDFIARVLQTPGAIQTNNENLTAMLNEAGGVAPFVPFGVEGSGAPSVRGMAERVRAEGAHGKFGASAEIPEEPAARAEAQAQSPVPAIPGISTEAPQAQSAVPFLKKTAARQPVTTGPEFIKQLEEQRVKGDHVPALDAIVTEAGFEPRGKWDGIENQYVVNTPDGSTRVVPVEVIQKGAQAVRDYLPKAQAIPPAAAAQETISDAQKFGVQPAPVVENGRVSDQHVAAENGYFDKAKAELGPDATFSQIAMRAQELKNGKAAPPVDVTQPASISTQKAEAPAAPKPFSLVPREGMTADERFQRAQRIQGLQRESSGIQEELSTATDPKRIAAITERLRQNKELLAEAGVGKAPAPVAKQPWEMTRGEFMRSSAAEMRASRQQRLVEARRAIEQSDWQPAKPLPVGISKADAFLAQEKIPTKYRSLAAAYNVAKKALDVRPDNGTQFQVHGRLVRGAVESGKPVPPEVLADYPDLQKSGVQSSPMTPKVEGAAPSSAHPVPASYKFGFIKKGNTAGFTSDGLAITGKYMSGSKAWRVDVMSPADVPLSDRARNFPTKEAAETYARSIMDAQQTAEKAWWDTGLPKVEAKAKSATISPMSPERGAGEQSPKPQQQTPAGAIPSDLVYHNTTSANLDAIRREGFSAGSFSDKPGDFGGDVHLAVSRADLPNVQEHQYGNLRAYEPSLEALDAKPIPPDRIYVVNKRGKVLGKLSEYKSESVLPQQESPKSEVSSKSNWRAAYDSSADVWRQKDILKAIANGKSTPAELSDVLDRLKGILPNTGAYDIAYDVSRNKAATPEVRNRATALYEERYPSTESPKSDVTLPPSKGGEEVASPAPSSVLDVLQPKKEVKQPWQMSKEERAAEVVRLKRENEAALHTPLMSEGSISPAQVGAMSKRQHAQWVKNAQIKMDVESQIRTLQSDERIAAAKERFDAANTEQKDRTPWLWTKEEWVNRQVAEKPQSLSHLTDKEFAKFEAKRHAKSVKWAMANDKPIPPEVLADYPDLAKPAEAKPAGILDVLQGKKKEVVEPQASAFDAITGKKRTAEPPDVGYTGEMPVAAIRKAPGRFQYKLGTDAEGVGTLLKDQSNYNPDLAGVITVWRDPADGQTYVINGHHRLELAERTGQENVVVRHVRANDAVEARSIGALQNIAEGRGTPIDAAKFMRDSGLTPDELRAKGVSMGEATAAKGVALSRLDDTLFNRAVQGDMPLERAVAIGEATPDHAEQRAIADLIQKKEASGKRVTNDTLRELVRFVRGSGTAEETVSSLFGEEHITKSLALEKAEVSSYIKQQMAKDKKLFGYVSKDSRASELERGNNVIDVKTSRALAEQATQGEELYNRLSERAGPIASALDDAAARLAKGDNANAVKQQAYDAVSAEISKTLGGSEGARSNRGRKVATREATLSTEPIKPAYRVGAKRGELDWGGSGLSEEQVQAWSKSKSLKIADGGEQDSLFGEPEKMYRFTREDADGVSETALIREATVRRLVSDGNQNIMAALRRGALDIPGQKAAWETSLDQFLQTNELTAKAAKKAYSDRTRVDASKIRQATREWEYAVREAIDKGEDVSPAVRGEYDAMNAKYADEVSVPAPKKEEPQASLFGADTHPIRPGAQVGYEGKNPEASSHLRQITEAIEHAKASKQPGAVFDAIKEPLRNSRSAISEAAAGAAQASSEMFHKWADGPKWSSFHEALGKYLGEREKSALDLQRFSKAIKEAVPDVTRRSGMSNYIEAAGDQNLLRERFDKTTDKRLKAGYEAALSLTADERTVANNIIGLHDALLEESIRAGILEHGVDNYIQHVWQKANDFTKRSANLVSSAMLQTNPKFALKRVFPSFFDGEQAGFSPATKDAAHLTVIHQQSFTEALAARRFIKDLLDKKAADGRPIGAVSGMGSPVEGEAGTHEAYLVKPNAKPEEIRDYRVVDHPALRKWKWAGKTEDGKPIYVQGDILIHPDHYAHLRNVLSKSWFNDPTSGWFAHGLGKALRLSREVKATLLSLSGFHQVQEGLHAVGHNVVPIGAPKLDLENPIQYSLVSHGLRVADFHAAEQFGEGVSGAGLVNRLPVVGPKLMQYQHYLFQDYIPRLKMKMALDALERNQKRYNGKLSDDQILRLTAEQSNAAFGGLNYKMMGRNPTMQDIFSLTTLAPDFLEARGRFVGQALKPFGKEQRYALGRLTAELYVGARLINYALTGNARMNDPRDAFAVVYNDRRYEMRSVPGDVMHLTSDWRSFIYNRLNPSTTRPLIEALTGRDQYGRKVDTEQKIMDAIKTPLPIPLRGFLKDTNRNPLETVLESVGVHSTKHDTPAGRLALEKAMEAIPAGRKTREALDRSRMVREYGDKLKNKEVSPRSLVDMLRQGRVSEAQVERMVERSKTTELQRNFQNLTLSDALDVWDVMSESERKQTRPILESKAENHRWERELPDSRKALAKRTSTALREKPEVASKLPAFLGGR